MKTIKDIIYPKLEYFERHKKELTTYAKGRLEDDDYHAVADSMEDLRDVKARIEVLEAVLRESDGHL